MPFVDKVLNQPIIGAIGTQDPLDEIIQSPCEVFFILSGTLSDLKTVVDAIIKADKLVFVHVDLLSGLKADSAGLKFLKDYINPTGIITTKGSLIREAKTLGLYAIQRLFLLDSKNLESGVQSVKKYQPDALEVLPGTVHKATAIIIKKTNIPVITGGLIMDKEDVIQSLKIGAVGVSTSNRSLWSI